MDQRIETFHIFASRADGERQLLGAGFINVTAAVKRVCAVHSTETVDVNDFQAAFPDQVVDLPDRQVGECGCRTLRIDVVRIAPLLAEDLVFRRVGACQSGVDVERHFHTLIAEPFHFLFERIQRFEFRCESAIVTGIFPDISCDL